MDEVLLKIRELYEIDTHISEKVTKGFLSENHILSDGEKKYFLKKYRFDSEEKIKGIHSVKKYFAAGGIPVILPILNRENRTFFYVNGGYYALFPFISGRHIESENLTDVSIISLGETLAKIHLLGKKSKLTIGEDLKAWDKTKTLSEFESIINVIQQQKELNDFDKLALKDINMRKSLVASNTINWQDLDLKNDHLLHGDYYDQNVFFDERGYVSSVFDFEKTIYSPRSFELIRSMMKNFFSNDFNVSNINKAKLYLHSYLNIYPASREELRTGFRLYYLRTIHSAWVQKEHYLKKNYRVDQFLHNHYQNIKYLSEHFQEVENDLID